MKYSNTVKRMITIIASAILLIALLPNYLHESNNLQPKLEEALPDAVQFNKVNTNPLTFEGLGENGEQVGYVVAGKGQGYGGPLQMLTGINSEGDIIEVVIAEHKDTPSFIKAVVDAGFLKQFKEKKINEPIRLDKDVDALSGATLSSRGITKAVREGSHAVGKNQFNMSITEEIQPITFGTKEIVIIGLVILTLIGIQFKLNQLRWVTLIGGLVFIGFKYNSAISIGNIAGVLMGYFPPIKEYIFWYVLFIAIPALTFIIKKNFYCYWMCPFGACQEVTAKLGGGKFRCHKSVDMKLRKIKYGLAYISLLMAFIYKSPSMGGYEPFATLFNQLGSSAQWFMLPIVVISSLFIKRFWCNYFCPVGVLNEVILKGRRFLDGLFNRKKLEQGGANYGKQIG